MAITTEITTRLKSSKIPSGFTNPTTTIEFSGTPIEEGFTATIAISGVSHAATASTGLTQLLAAVKTWVDDTWIPDVLKLNDSATIEGIIYVDNVIRQNSQTSIYVTGTEQYVVMGVFKYE